MGKRVGNTITAESHHHLIRSTPPNRSIRKRKQCSLSATAVAAKVLSISSSRRYWNDEEKEEEEEAEDDSNSDADDNNNDSSSNDSSSRQQQQLASFGCNSSTKQANNSSIVLNRSLSVILDGSINNESPKPVYALRPSVVNGTVLHDLTRKPWRLGKPIGKGNFGEIFLASDKIGVPVTNENANFVVKIEPHSNGPLFVEIHCLMNAARKTCAESDRLRKAAPPSGIPDYIASGSHYFGDARYRFLVLQRFDRDLHSLIRNCRVHQKSIITLAIHIVNALEKLHDKGYCHNDVKAQNLMISKCKYKKQQDHHHQVAAAPIREPHIGVKNKANVKHTKLADNEEEKQQTTDSGNSSEQEAPDEENDGNYIIKRKSRRYKYSYYDDDDYDEDFDDGTTSQSNNSTDVYSTPANRHAGRRRQRNAPIVEYSGSNPMRSCRSRRQEPNPIYDEMVKSHYLRPTKRISYSEFFSEDQTNKDQKISDLKHTSSDDDESDEFLPASVRRTIAKQKSCSSTLVRRQTRQQEKLSNGTTPQQKASSNATATNCARAISASRLVAIGKEELEVEEEHIFLIDFGLASKFKDNGGVHRPFTMDQRRAHDGTLEFTSRDAHMGAHSRRSDLECLGYNLIFWSEGYLPWKDAVVQHQQEKVHRAKEYLMTDVREMLKQIYGKQVPKILGEFLYHVGQLAYHQRPDYAYYRRLFESEYQQLGYSLSDMRLDGSEIMRSCVRFKEEIENKKDIFEINKINAFSIMKSMIAVGTPFHERTLSNRVSPKNLRSKSSKKEKKQNKFSWAEILSQDPDQIARERAEKELDREEFSEEVQQPIIRRYQGKPTYAILEVQRRMRLSGRIVNVNSRESEGNMEEDRGVQDFVKNNKADEVGLEEISNKHYLNHKKDNGADSDAEHTPQTYCRTRRVTRGETTARKVRAKTATNNNLVLTTGRKRTTYNSLEEDSVTLNKTKVPRKNRTATAAALKTATTSRGVCVGNGVSDTEVLHAIKHQDNRIATMADRPAERRTRRCLIKIEAKEKVSGEESFSDLSPDMRGLFHVWKNTNSNESSPYVKDDHNAAVVPASAAPNKYLRK